MRTVDIPGWGTARLREASELRAKDSDEIEIAISVAAGALAKFPSEALEPRRENETAEEALARQARASASVQLGRDEMQQLIHLRRATIVAVVADWTLDLPLPASVDEVGELPRDVVRALEAEVLALDVSPPDFSPTADKDSPTSGSGSSDGFSEARTDPGSKRTRKPSAAGRSTSTGKSTRGSRTRST